MHQDDSPPRGNRAYERDKRAMLSGAAMLLASASFAVGAWAHAKIWENSARLSVVETQQKNDGDRRIASDMRQQRMEDKLDRILEKLK